MNTYRIGRFAIDVPVEFKLAHWEHEFRLVGIEEFPVPDPRVSVQYAERKWKERDPDDKWFMLKNYGRRDIAGGALIKDSDWYANRGGYRDRVDAADSPAIEESLNLVIMQLPDASGCRNPRLGH